MNDDIRKYISDLISLSNPNSLSINDLWEKYFNDSYSYQRGTIQDKLNRWFSEQLGIQEGTLDDKMLEYLSGYEGTLNDRIRGTIADEAFLAKETSLGYILTDLITETSLGYVLTEDEDTLITEDGDSITYTTMVVEGGDTLTTENGDSLTHTAMVTI